MDKGESVGPYVARLLDIIDKSGLPYRLGPLGTCVEGDFDAVMNVVRKCHELRRRLQPHRLPIKMDYRKGHNNMLDSKISSVEQRLGRKLKTGTDSREPQKLRRHPLSACGFATLILVILRLSPQPLPFADSRMNVKMRLNRMMRRCFFPLCL